MAANPDPFLEGFLESPVPPAALRELEAAFGELGVAFDEVLVRSHPLGTDVFGDASWTEHHDSDSGGGSYTVRRTFLFCHRPETTLPEFAIHAKRGITGNLILGLTAKLFGTPSLELEDRPDFNARFAVLTTNPKSVRTLLVPELVDALVAIEDACLAFTARGVLFTRHPGGTVSVSSGMLRLAGKEHDDRVPAAERTRFLQDAVTICAPIADDPDAGRRAAAAAEGTYAEEAFRTLAGSGSLVAAALRRRTVTREMLDLLQTQPVPRSSIPAPVRRRGWAGTTFPLLILGFILTIVVGIGVSLHFQGDLEGPAWILAAMAGALTIATGFVLRHRLIRRRIIIRGRVVPGRIGAVERTDTSVNGDVVHAITIEPEAAGEVTVVAKMGSQPAKAARRMMESGRSTWVLVDPRRPDRGIWPHGWGLEAMSD